MHAGILPPGRRHPPPKQTATVADGTHPTGMHSCFLKDETARFLISTVCLVGTHVIKFVLNLLCLFTVARMFVHGNVIYVLMPPKRRET